MPRPYVVSGTDVFDPLNCHSSGSSRNRLWSLFCWVGGGCRYKQGTCQSSRLSKSLVNQLSKQNLFYNAVLSSSYVHSQKFNSALVLFMPYSNFELYNCQRQRVGLCDKVAQTLWIDAVTHPHIRQHLMGIIRQAQILNACLPRSNIFPIHLTTMKISAKKLLVFKGRIKYNRDLSG